MGVVEITATTQDGSDVSGKLEVIVLSADGAIAQRNAMPTETPLPSEEPGLLDGDWRYRIDENGFAVSYWGIWIQVRRFSRCRTELGGYFVTGINGCVERLTLARSYAFTGT